MENLEVEAVNVTSLGDDQCIKGSYGSESKRQLINSEEPKLKQSNEKKRLKIPSCYLTLPSECHFFVLVNITTFQTRPIFFSFSFLIIKNLLILKGDFVTGVEVLCVVF